MILVTLGTQDKDFSRLLKEIDKQIEEKNIKEKVIVQAGYTKYDSSNMELFDLISPEELETLVKKCSILITHGGVGSILLGLKYEKPIIAAARLKKYGEHTNDHQKQIIKEFEKNGYLLALKNFNNFDQLLIKAKKFKPNQYESNTDNFIKNIDHYIEKDNHTSWFNQYLFLTENGYRGILFSLLNLFIFYFSYQYLSLCNSILISFFTTAILSFLFHKMISISYDFKNYGIMTFLLLLIDFSWIFFSFDFSVFYLKAIINVFSILFSMIVIRYVFKNKF